MDLAEYHNKAIAKSTKNLLTSSLPAFLLPTFLPPTFEPLISSLPAAFKKFNCCYTSASLKRQADKIVTQNI